MDSPRDQVRRALEAWDRGAGEEAVGLLKAVVAARPDVPECHLTLGLLYESLGRDTEAVAALARALSLRPDLDEARQAYVRCLERRPDAADGFGQMATAFAEADRPREAEAAFRRALELDPAHAVNHNNFGLFLTAHRRYREALGHFRRAVTLRPDYANAHWNLALALLRLGHWTEGWTHFTWRSRADLEAILPSQRQARTLWTGSSFPGRRLLVRYEQGVGDLIQCLRYLPAVKALGGTVILEAPAALHPLLTDLPHLDACVTAAPDGQPTVDFDEHVFVMDLPGLFGTTPQHVPGTVPYLTAPPARVATWRRRLAGPDRVVGIVWAGSPRHRRDAERSCPLVHWSPLWDLPGIRWVGLQKGPAAAQAHGLPVTVLGNELTDWADTAAVLEVCDLVLSVDTAVLHLAGALNQPVWGLLPCVPDWRWLIDRSDSPWYPSLRLFRQPQPGAWDVVFHAVRGALSAWLETPRSS